MFKTPVLFLVFNRPAETEKAFQVIRNIAPKYLYIAADGPRYDKNGEPELCKRVREIVTNIHWDCEIRTLFRENNLGCKKAVSEAINWFFFQEEQGIILEDDCIADLSFFPYCEQLLEKYKTDEHVISISGTNLGYELPNKASYGFSRFMNMWGWATWRRSAMLIDYDMRLWKKMSLKKLFLYNKLKDDFFAFDYGWIKFWLYYFNITAAGEMDTWDYQWLFAQFYYNKVSIFPAKNLIKNIGFSDSATHTLNSDHAASCLHLEPIMFPLNSPCGRKVNVIYEKKFIKRVWFNQHSESFYRILRSDFLNSDVGQKISKLIDY